MVHVDGRRKRCGVFPRGSNDGVVSGLGISEFISRWSRIKLSFRFRIALRSIAVIEGEITITFLLVIVELEKLSLVSSSSAESAVKVTARE